LPIREPSAVIDWPAIVRDHGPAVWGTVYRLVSNREDANDCYQEAFLQAAQFASRQTVANWSALLKRIATGRALDCLRRRYRSMGLAPLEAAVDRAAPDPTPAAQAELRESIEQLRRELATLPSEQAEVFWLREVELMSTAEVADELQVAPDQVATWLYRAKQKLRSAMRENDPTNNGGKNEVLQ
jgi:RNA polymerase sigma-70 factor (ECF subfamily)